MNKAIIRYCVIWNYKPRAAGLADRLKEKYNIKTSIIEGIKGQFDIEIDNVLIFSKVKEGRFPEIKEIFAIMDKRNNEIQK